MALSKDERAKINRRIENLQDKLAYAIWDQMGDMQSYSSLSKTEIKRITLRDCKMYIKDYPNWKQ